MVVQKQQINPYNDHLVQKIAQFIEHEPILRAFVLAPRHLFVHEFFLPANAPGQLPQWRRVSPQLVSEDEWLQQVYTNQPLITRIAEDGYASSSSSKPSIMALMLQVLQVSPGQRVLEIGTGTGWNAALLSNLAENAALVTTIDIDPSLIAEAESRITSVVGPGMTIVTGDGREGYQPNAPFDRIIATGSYPYIPFAWLDQLGPGGRLVMNCKTPYVSMMLLACRDSVTGEINGNILDTVQGEFMQLHDGTGIVHNPGRKIYPANKMDPVIDSDWDQDRWPFDLITNAHFQFFLWLHFPQMHAHLITRKDKSSAFYYLHDKQTDWKIQFNFVGHNDIRGSQPLWRELQDILEYYRALDYPVREAFTFGADQYQQYFMYADARWNIACRGGR
ncbi:methyltransferase domain-containing protein [Dictyobacter kobayashii]|uniref:Protein-L-isoaspartate O-methyltransferase n=1 Tax=Dictyobacter kobayashii TaxID=2014872 RepID=A0A402ACC2_9CHLR|nr:methyltransferase domain-containing protein [Dictyobacter kobayashii]GCE16743.1 hypothetical protein KDK_05430 [Dictyobacter kobayashii]